MKPSFSRRSLTEEAQQLHFYPQLEEPRRFVVLSLEVRTGIRKAFLIRILYSITAVNPRQRL